jgi:sugar lactone lactonase YvrE
MVASLLYNAACILGESPLWDSDRNSFFWADIEGKSFYEYNRSTRKVKSWQLNDRVSLLTACTKDGLLLALQGGLAKFDLETGNLSRLSPVENELPGNRTNDGACDSKGRLWIGTMDVLCKENAGSLYCIDNSLVVSKKISNLTISNGITWSLDDKSLYHIDSPTYCVQSYLFDAETGNISGGETVIHVPEELGMPDGMTIDEEGMLWIAHWGGFGVYRWNPRNGRLLDKITVPVPNVTSCAFGGEQLDELFITTAREHLSEEELKKYPGSGSVFMAIPGVKGIAANKFTG